MAITDYSALKEWSEISKDDQQIIIDNVWCSGCRKGTTIVDYSINYYSDEINEVVLTGKCKKCGHKVVRVLEKD